jgi:CRISPR/Cas system-associated exonuclease Cas4 (RecB family)
MTWSFSRINSFFEGCKYAWKQIYLDENRGEDNCFGLYGSFMHEILEKYYKGELEIFELSQYYEENFTEKVYERFPPNKYTNLRDKYFSAGLEFFNNFEDFNYKIVGVEKEVNFYVEEYKFKGFIDLLAQDENGDLIIIDHKTKSKFKNKKELKEYLKQLYLYSIPVYEEYKKYPSKLIFNMAKAGEIIEENFNINDFEATKKWAVDTIHIIEKETEFKPKIDSFLCKYICNFRNFCNWERAEK